MAVETIPCEFGGSSIICSSGVMQKIDISTYLSQQDSGYWQEDASSCCSTAYGCSQTLCIRLEWVWKPFHMSLEPQLMQDNIICRSGVIPPKDSSISYILANKIVGKESKAQGCSQPHSMQDGTSPQHNLKACPNLDTHSHRPSSPSSPTPHKPSLPCSTP